MARTRKRPDPVETPDTGTVELKVKAVGDSAGLAMPRYETEDAAGMDLLAAIPGERVIAPGDSAVIPAGISIELPKGYEAQVRPRSGLAAKNNITVLNSPGTIDRDYRGEVGVILINHGKENFTVRRGMRIAQLVIAPVAKATVTNTDDLSETDRGSGGFGSTGQGTEDTTE